MFNKKSEFLLIVLMFFLVLFSSCSYSDDDSIIKEGAEEIVIDDLYGVSMGFSSCEGLNNYLKDFLNINDNYYFLNFDDFFMSYDFDKSIAFNYYSNKDSYADSFICIKALIYDESIGSDVYKTEFLTMNKTQSYSMLFIGYKFNSDKKDFKYKLFKYDDDKTIYNHVLYVYCDDVVVSKLFYSRENDLNVKYFEELFSNYSFK